MFEIICEVLIYIHRHFKSSSFSFSSGGLVLLFVINFLIALALVLMFQLDGSEEPSLVFLVVGAWFFGLIFYPFFVFFYSFRVFEVLISGSFEDITFFDILGLFMTYASAFLIVRKLILFKLKGKPNTTSGIEIFILSVMLNISTIFLFFRVLVYAA
ncbi:hypothetical protein [Hahella ganghwensis]|uniref:hypothetical protein n=1 Tax=Hahella ganghwensis TaxID=286420 RepID=UPI00146148BB|nr:hypothetical protein [Hahella ganghwensis]